MHSYLQEVQQAIDAATAGMTTEQLLLRRDGKWSASEILEHLGLTYSGSVRALEKCLKKGPPSFQTSDFRHRFARFLVVGLKLMPSGRSSPVPVMPAGEPPESVLSGIRENLRKMDQLLGECQSCFGKRVKIANHPFLGPLTAKQWRIFHWVHARHHLKQIRRSRSHGA